MAALIRGLALGWALAAVPVRAAGDAPQPPQSSFATPPAVRRWHPFMAEASRRFAIPEIWIAAVMHAESGGLTLWQGRPITSHAGAMGLMQVMPATWGRMRARYQLGSDPYDPHDNIMAGAAYLRLMHDRFGYPGLFAAYNAGPARYEAHLYGGRTLPAETRDYIAELARTPAAPTMPPAILSGTRLFFTLGDAQSAPADPVPPEPSAAHADADRNENAPMPDTLFVPLGSLHR